MSSSGEPGWVALRLSIPPSSFKSQRASQPLFHLFFLPSSLSTTVPLQETRVPSRHLSSICLAIHCNRPPSLNSVIVKVFGAPDCPGEAFSSTPMVMMSMVFLDVKILASQNFTVPNTQTRSPGCNSRQGTRV